MQDRSAPVAPPSKLLAWSEPARALGELAALPWFSSLLMTAPRGDGHPVMVLPGFVTTDASTAILRRYLAMLGYDVRCWELGRNLGPKAIGRQGEKLEARLRAVHKATGKTVSLIGWSLGGVMARQVARAVPEAVRQIVTLGAPFTGDPYATNVMTAYRALTDHDVGDPETRAQLRESATPPPVPSTAIYTRADGIVAWRNCVEPAAPTTDNIEVRGSHCGLGINAAVLYAIADRLAQEEDAWAPFDRSGLLRTMAYPSSGHVH